MPMPKISRIKTAIDSSHPFVPDAGLIPYLQEITREVLGFPSFLLVYKYDEIVIGLSLKGLMRPETLVVFEPRDLFELRLFSPRGEFHLWRAESQFKCRLRVDEEEGTSTVPENFSDSCVYEEEHVVWGIQINEGNVLEEPHRGMRLPLPFVITKEQLPLKYKVRNYFEFDADGLIQFVDARMIEFFPSKGEIKYA